MGDKTTDEYNISGKQYSLEANPKLRVYNSSVEAIRDTALIRLNKIGKDLPCEIWVKCDFFNPGGSIKDRIGRQMIEDAEKQGRIKKGDTLIEPTSGNTGIGLALTAAVKGYDMIITLPQKMSAEKVAVLEGLGAKIVRTPTEAAFDSPESHIGVAKKLNKEIPNSHILDQYGNPSNPNAHYEHTAEELLAQTGGKIDVVVVTAGTGGSITGIARKLKEKIPNVKVVGVDPYGSILAGPGPISSYQVEGIGYDFVPDVLDRNLVDQWVRTRDKESFVMARRLIREEGLLVGGSCGACLAGALQVAPSLKKGERMVCVLADGVRNYMSKFLDDKFMYDWEHYDVPVNPKLKDRTVADLKLNTPKSLKPSNTVADAIKFLTEAGTNAVPVVDDAGRFEAVLTDESINMYLTEDSSTVSDPVLEAKAAEMREISNTTSLSHLQYILSKNPVAFVTNVTKSEDGNKHRTLVSTVTKRDLLLAHLK